tara:strand:- start:2777 stop:3457 length:681 start_codon:yes stop_codon:yes gene_type:complete
VVYLLLVYLLWRADSASENIKKYNEILVEQIDSNSKDFEELTYHNDILKTEAKFVLDQHEEILQKYNTQYDLYMELQSKFKILENTYTDKVKSFETEIKNILALNEQKLEKEKKKARQDALKRSRSVMRGQATEHLAPYVMENTNPKDCRFLGNPIDYIVFDGLSAVTDKTAKEINGIKFVDIKTGKSTLSTTQRRIRDAIKEGRVSFEIVNPDKKEKENDSTVEK